MLVTLKQLGDSIFHVERLAFHLKCSQSLNKQRQQIKQIAVDKKMRFFLLLSIASFTCFEILFAYFFLHTNTSLRVMIMLLLFYVVGVIVVVVDKFVSKNYNSLFRVFIYISSDGVYFFLLSVVSSVFPSLFEYVACTVRATTLISIVLSKSRVFLVNSIRSRSCCGLFSRIS